MSRRASYSISTARRAMAMGLVDEVFGGTPDSFMAEYGGRQYEFTVDVAEGMRAADRAVVAREMARAGRIAWRGLNADGFIEAVAAARARVGPSRVALVLVTSTVSGVFGMAGDQGKLKEIVERKAKYNFRLFVDDAHGFGMMGRDGRGTADAQGVMDQVDVYFGTFAKAMASIGAFISGPEDVMMYMRYNMRSQTFAKSLPMPVVIGLPRRLE